MVSSTLNWVIAFTNVISLCERALTACHSQSLWLSFLILIHVIKPILLALSETMSYCINILYWYFLDTPVNIGQRALLLGTSPSHLSFIISAFSLVAFWHYYGNCLFKFYSVLQVVLSASKYSWDENYSY